MSTLPHRDRPSVSERKTGRTLWSIFLVLLESLFVVTLLIAVTWGGAVVYKRLTSDIFFPLEEVLIDDEIKYGDPKEVYALIIDHAQKRDLLHIDVINLANEIKNLSWVKKARIYKHWPKTIKVQLEERVPVVRWGEHEFLDQNGYRFAVPNTPELHKLFPLNGPDGYEKQVLQRYQQIQPWLTRQKIEIEKLYLDPRLSWHLTLKGGIEVILGRDHLNERLKKLVVIQRKVAPSYQKKIVTMDLRYQDGFSVRWKKGVTPTIEERNKKKTSKKKGK